MVKPVANKTPIRGNLRFSPSPKPTKQKPKRAAVSKRKSLSRLPVKIAKSRAKKVKQVVPDNDETIDNGVTELEPEIEMETPSQENIDGTFIVLKKDKKKDIEELKMTTPILEEESPVKKRTRPIRARATSKPTPAPKDPVTVNTKPKRGKKVAKPASIPEDEPEPMTVDPIEFSNFKFTRVINDSSQSKTIAFLGTYKGDDAVIRLEKSSFDEDLMKEALLDKNTVSTRDFNNDIYSSYSITSTDSCLNTIKATVICPANDKVVAKYSRSEKILFNENPDVYTKVVEPFIANLLESDPEYNKWVYNILDGQSEAERVIFNDPDPNSGFVLVRDLKWSGDEKDVYLIAISQRRDIRSIRDLNDKHLILLKNILTKGTKTVKDKFKDHPGQLRSYIHYQPSFYHFHVHFKMVDASDYASSDRDHLLGTVINNISLHKDYYKKSTLTYPLSTSSALYLDLEKAKRV